MFMDFGHSHTSASLISYQRSGSPPIKGASRVSVLKTNSNFGIGGASIDIAIRDYFYEQFCKQDSKNIISDPIELARIHHILIEEASSAKFRLTATSSVNIFVDSLYQGHPLKLTFSKSDLEDITKNLIPQFMDPFTSMLTELGYTPQTNINKVECFSTLMLIGGTSRIPFIQDALKNEFVKFFGSNHSIKFGFSVNSDEGPALGAALKALISDIKFNANTIKLSERPVLDTFVIRNPGSSESEPILLWGKSSPILTPTTFKASPPAELFKKLLVYSNESFSLDVLIGPNPSKRWCTIDIFNVTESFNDLYTRPLNESLFIRAGNPFARVGFSLPISGPSNGIVQVSSCDMVQKTNLVGKNKSEPILASLPFNITLRYPPLPTELKNEALERKLAIDNFTAIKRLLNSARNTLESNIFALRPALQEWKRVEYPDLREHFSPQG